MENKAEILEQPFKLLVNTLKAAALLLLAYVFTSLAIGIARLWTYSPVLGAVAMVLTGFGIMLLAWRLAQVRHSYPPRPRLAGQFTSRQYRSYLAAYSNSLLGSENLPADLTARLRYRLAEILNDSDGGQVENLRRIESEVIEPANRQLDEIAEEKLKKTVREISAAVILSPWRSLDSVLFLIRLGRLFLVIVRIYRQRPGSAETILIGRDVLLAVAAINILSYGDLLTSRFLKGVPVVDRFLDDVIQGIGAGMLATAVGRAAIARSRTPGCWNHNISVLTMKQSSGAYLEFVRSIVYKEVLPKSAAPWRRAAEADSHWENSRAALRNGRDRLLRIFAPREARQ